MCLTTNQKRAPMWVLFFVPENGAPHKLHLANHTSSATRVLGVSLIEPRFSSPSLMPITKGTPYGMPFVIGAGERTRTVTELPPGDFKSPVSTIPPLRRGYYIITLLPPMSREVRRILHPFPVLSVQYICCAKTNILL